MEITQFMSHLKDVASSPYALIGYIVVIVAWVYVVTAQGRLRNISKIISELPEEDRSKILLREYNTSPRKGLTAEQWIRSRQHTLLFLVFLAIILCGTILVIVTIYTKPSHRNASLSLVDLLVIETDEFPKIEIKVRNNSDEVVFLKKADLSTLGQWDLPKPGARPSAIPVSWTYDVKVPLRGMATYSISQEVKPNSVDRFEFRLGSEHSPYPFMGLFAYLLKIKLIYNEDNKELETPLILLHIPASMTPVAFSQFRPSLEELQRNKKVAQDILKIIDTNVIVNKDISEAVKSWAAADFSEFEKVH
jgi:hypothetical protein